MIDATATAGEMRDKIDLCVHCKTPVWYWNREINAEQVRVPWCPKCKSIVSTEEWPCAS